MEWRGLRWDEKIKTLMGVFFIVWLATGLLGLH